MVQLLVSYRDLGGAINKWPVSIIKYLSLATLNYLRIVAALGAHDLMLSTDTRTAEIIEIPRTDITPARASLD